jgi:hypothetical protein
MTAFDFTRLSISTRKKLVSVVLAIVIFAFLSGLTALAVGRPVLFVIIDAITVGLSVRPGSWRVG